MNEKEKEKKNALGKVPSRLRNIHESSDKDEDEVCEKEIFPPQASTF